MTVTGFIVKAGFLSSTIVFTSSLFADVFLFDLEGSRDSWMEALEDHNLTASGWYDLTAQFGDPGIIGMTSPQSLEGTINQIANNGSPHGIGGRHDSAYEGLAIVGASGGVYGHSETAAVANYWRQGFDIYLNGGNQYAAEFDVFLALSGPLFDLTIYAEDDLTILAQFTDLEVPWNDGTHRYGILSDEPISRINIYNTDDDAEGIIGTGTFYSAIPIPSTIGLLAVSGLFSSNRRRRI